VKESEHILVFNYAMDILDPIFSHQYEAVRELSSKYQRTTVITARVGLSPAIPNTTVISTDWSQGDGIRNLIKILKISIPRLIRRDYSAVFFHMTDVQSAILSPLVRILGKRQFLWYAHAHKSLFLTWTSIWVNNVLTSTTGSCPLNSSKVLAIGQAIDSEKFGFKRRKQYSFSRLLHIGRFDESKRIDYLIDSAIRLRTTHLDISLLLVGSPASKSAQVWALQIKSTYKNAIESGWLGFQESISRDSIPDLTSNYDVFIHGYKGSLDKSILEATMMGIPVVSENDEYLSIFGCWGDPKDRSLVSEFSALSQLDFNSLQVELIRRANLVVDSHSLQKWIEKLHYILSGHSSRKWT